MNSVAQPQRERTLLPATQGHVSLHQIRQFAVEEETYEKVVVSDHCSHLSVRHRPR